ncbi:uncharacterized protein LOC132557108 [Ylistrum balloti]|uniref:uncharacterized protein LOC132557108 n=1 Tax=Ylistrum balloti TaxID=509963 RepID=UPI0029057E97|nr:uncharacterized protein LOC132557108 [Ylistrum balloti]
MDTDDCQLLIDTLAQTHQSENVQTKTCATQLSYRRPLSKSVRIQVKPHRNEIGCQTMQKRPIMKDAETQCNIIKTPVLQQIKNNTTEQDLDISWTSTNQLDDTSDLSYCPSDQTEVNSECDENMELSQVFGTRVKVEQTCGTCGYNWEWKSQHMIGSIPYGNLRLSCGILFAGFPPSKALRVFDFMNVPSISNDTFLKHQKHYLQPVIVDAWESSRREHIQEAKADRRTISIGGDGRCDTPGHSAKFGSYSVMDLDDGRVLDIHLVQSNEVKSSCHVEKEGLARSVKFLMDHGLEVNTLVTDRHVQIRKWVRENMAGTKHCIDVWHVAKGIKKKLLSISKEKDCEEIHDWIKSISNHLYWMAASTPNADPETMWQKWASLEKHIQNIHEGHGTKFPHCLHPSLNGRERRRKWLKPGTKSMVQIEKIIDSRQMRLDIPMLSTKYQTSEVEGYHSVINQFAPKMHRFSFNGMKCRLILAALHFNENSGREQAQTKQGDLCYKVTFPKHKKGGYTLREVKTESTFNYAKVLIDSVMSRTENVSILVISGTSRKCSPTPVQFI